MKKSNIVITLLLVANISTEGLFKPSKPELVTDKILVPEKQFEVKFTKVKQLADVEYAKTNKKIKGANKKVVVPFYTITFPKKHRLEKSKYEKKKDITIVTDIEGISEETYKELSNWCYQDLIQQLTQAGFEVSNKEEVIQSPVYKKMKSKKEKAPKGYSTYFPQGMKAGGEFSISMITPKLMNSF